MNTVTKVMLNQKSIAFILYLCMFSFTISSAQDLHFSQFFSSPLSTNPANTGFIPDADFRLGAQYRNQFSNIMSTPYRTYSVFGDAQLFRDKFENGWIGIGGLLLSDVAGSSSLTSNKLYGSLAYHQMLGNSSLLSAGFNLGWVSKRINLSGLKFPDQFDGRFFDKSLPTAVVLTNLSSNYFDLQTGLNYAYFPNEDVYINAGYSLHHVNQSKETFFAENINSRIPMRYIAFINAMVKVNDMLIVTPNVFYTMQQRSSNLVLGSLANINLSEKGEKQLIAGCYYRWNESLIPEMGFELNKIQFLFSYDITVSALNKYNSGRGAAEISIVKKGFYGAPSQQSTLCPSF